VLATTQLKPPGVETAVYVEATPSATNETLREVAVGAEAVGVANAPDGATDAEGPDTVEAVLFPVGVTTKV
jgi:hypothetical protein